MELSSGGIRNRRIPFTNRYTLSIITNCLILNSTVLQSRGHAFRRCCALRISQFVTEHKGRGTLTYFRIHLSLCCQLVFFGIGHKHVWCCRGPLNSPPNRFMLYSKEEIFGFLERSRETGVARDESQDQCKRT